MKHSLTAVLKDLELPDPATLDQCFTRKIEYHRSESGLDRSFILNEKLGELTVLSRTDTTSEFIQSDYILSPLPSLRFSSILLSPTGTLLAICTAMSVQVMDVTMSPLLGRIPESARAKFLYHAFDIADSTDPEHGSCTIIRIRWHPLLQNTLVILTSSSFLYHVQCVQSENVRRIECRIRSEVNLNHSLDRHYRCFHEDKLVHTDSDYSSSEESELGNSYLGRNRYHASSALGVICVDFDFGAAWPTKATMDQFGNTDDLCIYVLFENGDIVAVRNFFPSKPFHRSQCLIQPLQILPPSVDNYGENFCSLLCISAGSRSPFNYNTSVVDLPPDVLILARRDGRILQGVVLHSLGLSRNHSDGLDGLTLCVMDCVNLELDSTPSKKCTQSNDFSDAASPVFDVLDGASLVLEPSRFSTVVVPTEVESLSQPAAPYPFTAYYVIHNTGIHMIRLPWLRHLTTCCLNFLENPLSSLQEGIHGVAQDWYSVIIHLVCSLVPRSGDSESSQLTAKDFRLIGFFELLPQSSTTDSQRPIFDSRELLFVRSPGRSISPLSCHDLVHVVRIPIPTISRHFSGTEFYPSECHTAGDNKCAKSTPLPRSDFAIQMRRLLRQEELHLPFIADLSLQSDSAQVQGVHFFLKSTELLRSASLDRLARARKFVEQYTHRLSNILPIQYKDACALAYVRDSLQQKAEELTRRHSVILQRQAMLDKRVALLTCRLGSLANGPSKAEVAMRDEIEQLQARLKKGLRNWFDKLQAKRSTLAKRYKELEQYRCASSRANANEPFDVELRQTQWKLVSDSLRHNTIQIRTLLDIVKKFSF